MIALTPWGKVTVGAAIVFVVLAFDVIPAVVHALVRRPAERDGASDDTDSTTTEGDPT